MTPQADIIPGARRILNDEDASGYRWSDAELIGWVNDCLDVMVDLRPDLFNSLAVHTCAAGAEQTLNEPRMRGVQNVLRVTGGRAVLTTDREVLDAFNPDWYSIGQSAAVNWMPHPESPYKFYLYPPAPIGQQVDVRFIQAHQEVGATDSINVPENYAPAIIAFCVARAEAKDDEQINSGRMQAFLSDFAGMIGVGGK